jgi:hypothetical protein
MNEDDNKVYYPDTIQDTPFPVTSIAQQSLSVSDQQPTSGTSHPSSISDNALPRPFIAHETLSSSLNTLSRKILNQFELADSGGLRIGRYTPGVNGEIDITPGGITALDQSGNTTFNIDGDTGNATFNGEIFAKDVQVIGADGLISLASFATKSVTSGLNFSTASAIFTDITDVTKDTDDLPNPVHALILATANIFADKQGVGDFEGEASVCITVNGVAGATMVMRGKTVAGDSNSDITTCSTHQFVELPAGVSTIKLQMKANQLGVGNFKAAGNGFELSFIILGR